MSGTVCRYTSQILPRLPSSSHRSEFDSRLFSSDRSFRELVLGVEGERVGLNVHVRHYGS